MTTISGYANYGGLAHEKQTIFTITNEHAYASVSEKVEITLPENWNVHENNFGFLIESPEGNLYKADEIISSWDDNPVLSWYDGDKTNRIKLDWKAL